MTSLLTLLLATSPAFACGGFGCDSIVPPSRPDATRVDQTNERVLFMVDEASETIEVHVEVGYTGDAAEFAWLVPVPEVPELMPSTRQIFDVIDRATEPDFTVVTSKEGTCKSRHRRVGGGSDKDSEDISTADIELDADFVEPTVEIALQQTVGPYEAVVLRGDDAEVILEWLVDNGYALSPELAPRLEPYIADESWFVALRMRKADSAGELVPLGMSYPGTEPVVPLQLTGIAAVPDMRLEIFLTGSARAVPENYLHLQPNPFAFDWFSAGSNYDEVITRAANEAGGHGFTTDAAVSTDQFDDQLWTRGRYLPYAFEGVSNLREFADVFPRANIPLSDGTVAFYAQGLPFTEEAAAQGWDNLGLWSCVTNPNCVSGLPAAVLGAPVDAPALVRALTEWEGVMQSTQAHLDSATTLTRLRSSISPEEMSLDPRFVFNADMALVNPERTANLTVLCRPTLLESEAPRRFELEDGRIAYLPPSGDWPGWDAWFSNVSVNANDIVEATARQGQPTLIADNRAFITEALAEMERDFGYPKSGCSCSSSPSSAGWLALIPGVLLLRRRRD